MPDTLVDWNDDFSVGNLQIDAQHKELVKMTNDFYAGCQQGGIIAKVHFMKTIQKALQYIKTHFATEEEIMERVRYPEYEVHKRQHEDFIAEVRGQIAVFETEDNPNPSGFVQYLMNWVLQHIADSDKKYVPYIARLDG
jgi:hemerythrin